MPDRNLPAHYAERVTSPRTTALFAILALLFLQPLRMRAMSAGRRRWAALSTTVGVILLFYTLNYHTLVVRLTPERLVLRFGIFRWTEALHNVAACAPDETSLWRIGGAGIHFSWFAGRYRALFNFLEHPRVVVSLNQKRGPVQELAFSTTRPAEVVRWVHAERDQNSSRT